MLLNLSYEADDFTTDSEQPESAQVIEMENFILDAEDIENLLGNDDNTKIYPANNELNELRNEGKEMCNFTENHFSSRVDIPSRYSELKYESGAVLTDALPEKLQKHQLNESSEEKTSGLEDEKSKNFVKVSDSKLFTNVDELIAFQSNINKTLSNLVESIQRTEQTRKFLKQQAVPRRNSQGSHFLTILNNLTTSIPASNVAPSNGKASEFSNVIVTSNESYNTPSPQFQPLKFSRTSYLEDPCRCKRRKSIA